LGVPGRQATWLCRPAPGLAATTAGRRPAGDAVLEELLIIRPPLTEQRLTCLAARVPPRHCCRASNVTAILAIVAQPIVELS